VEYDQRQEEEQFSFLNIHAWKIMSHRKEISHVHLITCYKAQEKVHSTHRKPQTDCKIGYFAGYFFIHLHWFVDMNCALLPSDKKKC